MSKLTWKAEERQIKTLRPLEENPFGKITEQKKHRLAEKLRKLGIFEIPTVDLNNDLLSFNKRWHILMELGRSEEMIEVMVPSRALSAQERKEIILSSNVHEGEWDRQILEEMFADIDMDSIGIDMAEIEVPQELLQENDEQQKEQPEYPIVAKMSEQYDAFVIVCDNEIDSNFISEFLQLGTMRDFKKPGTVGRTRVLRADKFMQIIKARS